MGGCGSLMGQSQYVSVDSSPRGAQVHDAKGRVVGKTPFFAQVSQQQQLSYYVRGADGDRHWTQRDCRYSWLGSPLENFCIGLLGAPLGGLGLLGVWGAGIGVDWWTGAAFNCPRRVVVKSALKAKSCPKYVVHLPLAYAPTARQKMTDEWIKSVRRTEPCAESVDPSKSAVWARRLRVNLATIGDREWDRGRFNRFGYETDASHIASLEVKSGSDGMDMLIGDVADLHTGVVVPAAPMSLGTDIDLTSTRGFSLLGLLRSTLSLVPESVAVASQVRRVSNTAESANESGEGTERAARLSAKLLSVSHPDAFRNWDYDLNLGPGFALDLFEPLTIRDDRDSTRFTRLGLHGIATLTGHTPVGAVSIEFGLGGSYIQISEGADSPHIWVGERVVILSYTGFLTSSIFFRLFAEDVWLSDDASRRGIAQIQDTGVMLGFYFEGIDSLFRDRL